MSRLSGKLTAFGICAAILATTGVASAQSTRHDRRQIARTEAKLSREQATYNRDIRTGHDRAAAREQGKIERTSARLRNEKRDLRHDHRGG